MLFVLTLVKTVLIRAVAVDEEAWDICDEYIGGIEEVSMLDEGIQWDIGDQIVALLGEVEFVESRDGEDMAHVGVAITDIDSQVDICGVIWAVDITHLLILISIIMESRHDIAQDGRCGRESSGPLAEHELTVVAFATDHDAIILIVDTIYIF